MVFIQVLKSAIKTSGNRFCNERRINIFCKYFSTISQENMLDVLYPDKKGVPQPLPGKYVPLKLRKRLSMKEEAELPQFIKDKNVIIQCKNAKLNHYRSQTYGKLEDIKLASSGWKHKKSKGDHFKINIFHENANQTNVFWQEEVKTFTDLGLNPDINSALEKLGFIKPTNIQLDGIPKVLRSQNTVLAGETGCGKTLAYLLPLIHQILLWRKAAPERKFNTPLALIVSPSRELTEQIGEVARKLSEELLFDSTVIIGGKTKKLLTNPSFYPMDLVIGSSGAISKLTTNGIINTSCVRHIVLDEADTLLDDSFNEQLVYFLRKFPLGFKRPATRKDGEKLPQLCQLTLASATMPTSIANILGDIIDVDSLVKVQTKRLHQVLTHVPQLFLRLGQSQKPAELLKIVKNNANKKIPTLIFSNRAATCDWISLFLNENDINCVNLNGEMSATLREGRFRMFQEGYADILSSSDIASRGLDTNRTKHVINYDFPVYMADYIHRCGRVGRIGSSDQCFITNFISGPKEVELVQKIEMSVRRMTSLPNVNANITKIILYKVLNNTDNALID